MGVFLFNKALSVLLLAKWLLLLKDLQIYLTKQIHLPKNKFELIEHLFVEETLEKRDYLVKQHHFASKMIFLRSGYLRCFSNGEHKEVTHWVYWKNRLVTDMRSFKGFGPSKWSYQAITPCQMVTLDKDSYLKVKSILPEWDTYENRILTLFFIALENRLSTFLSLNSKDRYALLHKSHPEIFNQIPLIYLSSMLGMAPETISRIRRDSIS